MASTAGARIVSSERPTFFSPSGLATRSLVDAAIGSHDLFIAEQSLRPGERVPRHVHPCDEVLLFLSGSGAAEVGETPMSIGTGVTLFVPAGVEHEFANTGTEPLRVVVVFPGSSFAETTLLEPGPRPPLAPAGGLA